MCVCVISHAHVFTLHHHHASLLKIINKPGSLFRGLAEWEGVGERVGGGSNGPYAVRAGRRTPTDRRGAGDLGVLAIVVTIIARVRLARRGVDVMRLG